MKIEKTEYSYLVTECDLKFGEQITLDGDVLIPASDIRAKIAGKIVKRPWLNFEDRERDRNDAFLEVLDIIDKYKSEGVNG